MHQYISRTLIAGAATLATAASLGLGADAASATTIREGSATSNPTAASPITATGASIGAGLSGTATIDVPGGGSPDFTCTNGAFAGTLGTNPTSPTVGLAPTVFGLNTCARVGATFDIDSIRLDTPGSGAIRATTAPAGQNGQVELTGTTLRARIRLASGAPGECPLVPVSQTVVGSVVNATGTVAFRGLAVRSPGGLCASLFNGSGGTGQTVIDASFARLINQSNAFRLGVFA